MYKQEEGGIDIVYLGRKINSKADHSKEIKRRFIQINSKERFYQHDRGSMQSKLSAIVRARLLYRFEIGVLKNTNGDILDAFRMWL